ncbi:MAG: glycosyltransferase family 1 protein, partial [Clostridiaceae bacterium]
NIQGEFLLYVGSIHPRKNLHVLLNILKEIKKYDCTRDMKLVIVGKYDGKRYEYYSKLRTMLRFLSIEDSVVFTGVVEYENMIYFYNGAECLINLSLYDGFPLSVLEAMACKAPVICNDNSLFEEIIKDGGILVDYHDETYIKEAILELLLNSNFRISIAEKGRQLSKIYTWKKAIQKTVEIYK